MSHLDRPDVTDEARALSEKALRRRVDISSIAENYRSLFGKLSLDDPDFLKDFLKKPTIDEALANALEQIDLFAEVTKLGPTSPLEFRSRIIGLLKDAPVDTLIKILGPLERGIIECAVETEMRDKGIDPYDEKCGKDESRRIEAMESQAIDMVRSALQKITN
jgi:hypothetical protein